MFNMGEFHEDFTLLNTVEVIFSDYYLYRNPGFRKIMEKNEKNYVPIFELFNERILQQYINHSEEDTGKEL